LKYYDITLHFDEIIEEEPFEGFTPDILLRSKKSGEAIFVEMAVCHPCSPEKIASGHRIIEYALRSEEDVNILMTPGIQEGTPSVNFFNFVPKIRQGEFCSDKCVSGVFNYFVIDKGGNASILSANPSELTKELSGPNIVISSPASQGDLDEQFRAFVKKAVREGVAVRNCIACEFMSDEFFSRSNFCRKTLRNVTFSEALRCRFFSCISR
jgi:hypothetical protein